MSENNNLQITGTIHHIGETQTFPSGFSKREFVLKIEEGKYSQTVPFELFKERADLIEPFKVGDAAEVHFNLRGNYQESTGRYYGSNLAWRLTKLSGVAEHRENQSLIEKLRGMITETGLPESAFDAAISQAYGGKITSVTGLGEAHLVKYCEPHVFAKIYDAAQSFAKEGPDLADEDLPF